jgi:fatty-acyl-CoA synthase
MTTSGALYDGPAIGDMIVNFLERYPDRIAFVENDETEVTYRDLEHRIRIALTVLRAAGVQRGESVMQIVSNRANAFAIFAACYLAGYRSVAPQQTASLDDHAFIARDCAAKVVVVDAHHVERAQSLFLAGLRGAQLFCHDPGQPIPHFWTHPSSIPTEPLRCEASPHDVVRLAYTGGTTGRPKGVMASSRSLAINAMTRMAGHHWGGLRFLCSTPITHATGSIIVPVLWNGGTIVLQAGFNKDRLLDAVESRRINSFYAVPTMLYALLDCPRTRTVDYSNLLMLMYGAAPASPARIQEALRVFGPILVQHYGATEAPSVVLALTQEDHLDEALLASAGKPYPGITVRLLDDADAEVKRGDVGEICVRGPMMMSGYHNQPELSAETTRNGWVHTGDLAYQNERGYFFIVDRKKDLIISGGFNVYPKEVEDVLAAHPSVSAAAVIGVPDDRWGEAVKALVVLRSDATATEAELTALVRQKKGPVCTPKSIDFVDSLPTTALGKPDKKAMRDTYWSGRLRNVN